MIRVRSFQGQDLQRVMEIIADSLEEAYRPELLSNLAALWRRGFLVAEVDGRTVGFIVGTIAQDSTARVLILAVEPAYRRRGVGAELLSSFMDGARERGALAISLEVRKKNVLAYSFYMNKGFRVVGTRENYYSNGESAVIMYMGLENG